jgi:hypothetical protein
MSLRGEEVRQISSSHTDELKEYARRSNDEFDE